MEQEQKSMRAYGHIGIYIGDGKIKDNVGDIRTWTIDEWLSWQNWTTPDGKKGWLGWGWEGIENPKDYKKNNDINKDNKDEGNKEEEKKDNVYTGTEKKTVIEVATWEQKDTIIKTNDPNVDVENTSYYNMKTTTINYQDLVSKYTMPFDLLWALLVVGEDQNFVLELANLVYNSKMEITVYDNYTKDTTIDEWNYTKEEKNNVIARVEELTENIFFTDNFEDSKTEQYKTTKTVINHTNTIDYKLTRADVWIVDYKMECEKGEEPKIPDEPVEKKEKDQEFSQEPISTSNEYKHKRIDDLIKKIAGEVEKNKIKDPDIRTRIQVNTYSRYINITNIRTSEKETTKYTSKPAEIKEKTDPESEEPNFITIFNKKEYSKNRSNINSVSSWLFEILESNDSTKNMVDLIKYLLYKATDTDYGVESFDFKVFDAREFSNTSVIAGDLIVKIDEANAAPVVERAVLEEGLKKWLTYEEQRNNALSVLDTVLEVEKEHKINAVCTYAIMMAETTMGTADTNWVRENNWTSLTALGHIQYHTPDDNIRRFATATLAGDYYFKVGLYSVYEIGEVYCADPPPPGWANNVLMFMKELYNACGVEVNTITSVDNDIVKYAISKEGNKYVYGEEGPNEFDCSGLVYWCYQEAGIQVPRGTAGYASYKGTSNEITWEEAQPGDILIIFPEERTDGVNDGHAGIYLGDDKYIHAANPTKGVFIENSGANKMFKHIFRFE